MKLILVVGPPRSGTSVTARILHEKLNVCMGHNLVPGNAGNPKGFYEDFDYVSLICDRNYNRMIELLRHGCDIVGVKSPELAHMDLEILGPSQVIRTRRPMADIARSLVKWKMPRISFEQAMLYVRHYESAINTALTAIPTWKVHDIFYDRQRDDDEIQKELELCLRGVTDCMSGS